MNRLFSWSLPVVALLGLAAAPIVARGQVQPVANNEAQESRAAHPLDPAIAKVQQSLSHVQSTVNDYTALFIKRCRLNGELQEPEFMNLKVRNPRTIAGKQTPHSAYMVFLKPATLEGREVIWVDGQNDGKVIAHEGGLGKLLTLRLDPNGFLAMRGSRYPVTEIGIEKLLIKVGETMRRDRKYDECEVRFSENARVGDTPCTMVQITHPVKRPHFESYRTRIYFSKEMNVPVRCAAWSWPNSPGGEPVLEEEYNYLDLKLNVGLTDDDFDPDNPNYDFP